MKFLYLDDSGSTKDPNQDHVVLGGLCIPDQGIRWLTYKLEEIAIDIDPDNPAGVEFHAVDIFAGRGHPWDKIQNKEERKDIMKRVLHTLDEAYDSTVAFAVAIHKKSFPNDDLILKAYEWISQAFNNHLDYDCEPPERGMIILDDISSKTSLQHLALNIRQTGNGLGLQNRSIIEIPLFVDSKASRLVQLADHIAYAVFRRYNAGDLNYFNIIEGRFLFKNGVMHSLSHLIRNANGCTCPSCITRRR